MRSSVAILLCLMPMMSFAQTRGDGRDRGVDVVRRLESLERRVRVLENLVESGGTEHPKSYFCVVQCGGEPQTQKGARGNSLAQAKVNAMTELTKKWACGRPPEVVECSPEY